MSLATRRQRENIFRHVCKSAGAEPFAAITRPTSWPAATGALRPPFEARHFLDTMRGPVPLGVRRAVGQGRPTLGVKNPRAEKPRLPPGPRMTSPLMRSAGRSARGSGCGSTSCSIPACAGRRGTARAPACSRRHSHVSRRRKLTSVVTLPILPALDADVGRGAVRRSLLHRRLARPADGEEVLQQRLQGSHAGPPAFQVPRMACARSRRRAPPMLARPSRSSKRSSAGRAARWRRSIRVRPIVAGLPLRRCTSSRTISELLLSHLCSPVSHPRKRLMRSMPILRRDGQRKSLRIILPILLLGRLSTNSISFGTL